VLVQVTLPLPRFDDNAPDHLSAVSTPSGVRDLLFVGTCDGGLLAYDAHTGALVWQRRHAITQLCPAPEWSPTPNPQPCNMYAAPAVSLIRRFVYSYGLDGRVHKHAMGDGAEVAGDRRTNSPRSVLAWISWSRAWSPSRTGVAFREHARRTPNGRVDAIPRRGPIC
jgi:hypothetical protein